jgi:hypothetical protein
MKPLSVKGYRVYFPIENKFFSEMLDRLISFCGKKPHTVNTIKTRKCFGVGQGLQGAEFTSAHSPS